MLLPEFKKQSATSIHFNSYFVIASIKTEPLVRISKGRSEVRDRIRASVAFETDGIKYILNESAPLN